MQSVLTAYCRRNGIEVGDQTCSAHSPQTLRCPYCLYEDDSSRMHTDETMAYVKRIVYREYMLPKVKEMLGGLGHVGRGNTGGLLSFSIEISHSAPPMRPLHGPEPPDFKIVDFLCCGQQMKVAESWNSLRTCPYCNTTVIFT